jgi:protoheme IX farnesyltransferase
MLTVTNGRRSTRNHIFVYSLILAFVALSIGFSSLSGPIYLLVALALNIQLIVAAFKLRARSENDCVDDNSRVERKFFKFSLLYLFFHFGAIMVETKTSIAWPGV